MNFEIVICDKVVAPLVGVEAGAPALLFEGGRYEKVPEGRIVVRSTHYDGNDGHIEYWDGRWRYTWARFVFEQEATVDSVASSFRRMNEQYPRYVQQWGSLSLVASGKESEFLLKAKEGAILFFLSHEIVYGNWTDSQRFDWLVSVEWSQFEKNINRVPPQYRRSHLPVEARPYMMDDMQNPIQARRFLPILSVLAELCSEIDLDDIDAGRLESLVQGNLDQIKAMVRYPLVDYSNLSPSES